MVLEPVASLAARLGIPPTAITVAGFAISVLSGWAFWAGWFRAAGGLLLAAGICDMVDGAAARAGGRVSASGAFLDSTLDRYAELFIYVGIWAYFERQGSATLLITLTMFFILFGSLMVSYTRARAEGLNVSCMVGLMQRGERIISIGVAGMVNSLVNLTARASEAPLLGKDAVLTLVLILLAVGTNLTALWRLFHVLNRLRH